jgi:hypothetical protein
MSIDWYLYRALERSPQNHGKDAPTLIRRILKKFAANHQAMRVLLG